MDGALALRDAAVGRPRPRRASLPQPTVLQDVLDQAREDAPYVHRLLRAADSGRWRARAGPLVAAPHCVWTPTDSAEMGRFSARVTRRVVGKCHGLSAVWPCSSCFGMALGRTNSAEVDKMRLFVRLTRVACPQWRENHRQRLPGSGLRGRLRDDVRRVMPAEWWVSCRRTAWTGHHLQPHS
jgi:hypothetical protein